MQPDFNTTLAFLKALANEQRLRIVGLLMDQRRSVQELAALIDLREPTVCHHLAVLNKVGLLEMTAEGNTHWYRVRAEQILALGRSVFGQERINIDPGMDEKRWDKRILENFIEGGQLKQIPASRKKRWVVLRWLADKFKTDEHYSEAR
jgi:DNA-binding transcriptional ArsR family regulator